MQDHPLRVLYPCGGTHYLVLWWSHQKQYRLVVAKSLGAAERAAVCAFKAADLVRVEQVLRVHVVAPHGDLCRSAELLRRADDESAFFDEVACMLEGLKTDLSEVPDVPNLTRPCGSCTGDTPGCSCGGLGYTIALTPQELYQRYWGRWQRVPTWTPPADPFQYSSADPADPSTPLWAVTTSYYGVQLSEVDASSWYREALFYFQGGTPVEALHQRLRATAEEMEVARERERAALKANLSAKSKSDRIARQRLRLEQLKEVFQ